MRAFTAELAAAFFVVIMILVILVTSRLIDVSDPENLTFLIQNTTLIYFDIRRRHHTIVMCLTISTVASKAKVVRVLNSSRVLNEEPFLQKVQELISNVIYRPVSHRILLIDK